jgi:hypothetical protein
VTLCALPVRASLLIFKVLPLGTIFAETYSGSKEEIRMAGHYENGESSLNGEFNCDRQTGCEFIEGLKKQVLEKTLLAAALEREMRKLQEIASAEINKLKRANRHLRVRHTVY